MPNSVRHKYMMLHEIFNLTQGGGGGGTERSAAVSQRHILSHAQPIMEDLGIKIYTQRAPSMPFEDPPPRISTNAWRGPSAHTAYVHHLHTSSVANSQAGPPPTWAAPSSCLSTHAILHVMLPGKGSNNTHTPQIHFTTSHFLNHTSEIKCQQHASFQLDPMGSRSHIL